MLIEQTDRHLVILAVAILKAFTYFFQGFAGTITRLVMVSACLHSRWIAANRWPSVATMDTVLLEGKECAPQRKARFILGGAKGSFRDHFPKGRGRERQVLSAFKGWKRREIFSWKAWNPEIASAGGQLSPMLLVDAEIEH
jgi:hypothetical protein